MADYLDDGAPLLFPPEDYRGGMAAAIASMGKILAPLRQQIAGSGLPNVGQVVSGDIRPSADASGNVFSLTVAAGTKVLLDKPSGTVTPWTDPTTITLTAGTFQVLDVSGGQPNPIFFLYCTAAGAIGVSNTPPATAILLAYSTYFSGNGSFRFRPYRPTTFLWTMVARSLSLTNVPNKRTLDWVEDFGAVGDGVTVNDDAIARLQAFMLARNAPYSVFGAGGYPRANRFDITVPPGTYVLAASKGGYNFSRINWIGTDKDNCIFRCVDDNGYTVMALDSAQSITFRNVQPTVSGSFAAPNHLQFTNCKFVINDNPGWTSFYFVVTTQADYVEFTACEWVYPAIYIPLWLYKVKSCTVRYCTFTCTEPEGNRGASHVIRVAEPQPGGRIVIEYNTINGPQVTGIFVAGDRVNIIQNVFIRGNNVFGSVEESISLDGFGNNAGLNPCIASGTITAVSNDVNGHLVVTPSLYYDPTGSSPNTPMPVNLLTTWANFNGTFETGSGLEGAYMRILGYDAGAGTLTLDTLTPASAVTVGGRFGVHGGFVGCVIEYNTIQHSYGSNNTYAVGISLWMECFDCKVVGNEIRDCAQGIDAAGGLCLSTFRNLCWNNTFRDNKIIRNNQVSQGGINGNAGALRLVSYYDPTPVNCLQYGNRVENNIFDGGHVQITHQRGQFWGNNTLRNGATLKFLWCGAPLPTAGPTYYGQTHMLVTDDGSGNATDISYWRCGRTAGVDAWVQT